jgi:hypothetical protein
VVACDTGDFQALLFGKIGQGGFFYQAVAMFVMATYLNKHASIVQKSCPGKDASGSLAQLMQWAGREKKLIGQAFNLASMRPVLNLQTTTQMEFFSSWLNTLPPVEIFGGE